MGTRPVPSRRTPPPRGRAELEEALERAGRHARTALAEALAAGRAMVEAAALASTGRPITEDGALGLVLRTLDELGESLSAGMEGPAAGLLRSVVEALDAEIARWEARASDDPEARAVLRAYLGLREILWELGVRPDAEPRSSGSERPRPGRVQRVPVEGAP
jgi:hypothetical protein